MMTSAQVVETSVNVTSNSPSQDYTHPDDHNLPNYDMTPGFKPFTRCNTRTISSNVSIARQPVTPIRSNQKAAKLVPLYLSSSVANLQCSNRHQGHKIHRNFIDNPPDTKSTSHSLYTSSRASSSVPDVFCVCPLDTTEMEKTHPTITSENYTSLENAAQYEQLQEKANNDHSKISVCETLEAVKQPN